MSRLGSEVEQAGSDLAPAHVLEKLHHNKVLQQRAGQRSVSLKQPVIRPEQRGQHARIAQEELGCFDQTLAEIAGPGGKKLNQKSRFKQGQIALQGAQRNATRSGQLRGIQQARRSRRQQGKETGQGGQSFDIDQVAHIALEQAGDIRLKPGLPACRARSTQDFWISTPQDAVEQLRPGFRRNRERRIDKNPINKACPRPCYFALGQGPQAQDLHPSHQQFGQARQEQDVGRAG